MLSMFHFILFVCLFVYVKFLFGGFDSGSSISPLNHVFVLASTFVCLYLFLCCFVVLRCDDIILGSSIPPLDQLLFLESESQSGSLGLGVFGGVRRTHGLAIGTNHQLGVFDAIQLDRTPQTGGSYDSIEGDGFPGFFRSSKGHGNSWRDLDLHGHSSSVVGHGLRIQIAGVVVRTHVRFSAHGSFDFSALTLLLHLGRRLGLERLRLQGLGLDGLQGLLLLLLLLLLTTVGSPAAIVFVFVSIQQFVVFGEFDLSAVPVHWEFHPFHGTHQARRLVLLCSSLLLRWRLLRLLLRRRLLRVLMISWIGAVMVPVVQDNVVVMLLLLGRRSW